LLIEHRQRPTGQWGRAATTQGFQPMFRGGQMIAVQNPHPIAAERFGRQRLLGRQHLSQPERGVTDQRFGNPRFQLGQLVVHRANADGHLVGQRAIGVVHRLARAGHDQRQQIDARGKQQLPTVLSFGSSLEQPVQLLGAQGPLQNRTKHHRHRALLHKPIEDRAKHKTPPGVTPPSVFATAIKSAIAASFKTLVRWPPAISLSNSAGLESSVTAPS